MARLDAYSRLERGQVNPTINAVEVIANTLGLTVFELFDRVREQMPVKKKGQKSRMSSGAVAN